MADLIVIGDRKRRTRHADGPPAAVDTWPPAWRELAVRWARRGPRCKWETLLAQAGGTDFETAHDLLIALLDGGWINVQEYWHEGRWQPLWVNFTAMAELRRALGLPDAAARQAQLAASLATLLDDASAAPFHEAAIAAAELRPDAALARLELLSTLAHWQVPAQATRRDFALAARGDTKGISSSEWEWLEAHIDLPACGIGDHTPLLCVAAPLQLALVRGTLDLAAAPDFIALPPATLEAAAGATGALALWTLVENRTSFERVARARAVEEGVLWLPGFPPGWWQTAITRLLALAPAPARIACDPDPAGIDIALAAGKLWQTAGLPWQPWRMGVAELAGLAQRKPLGEYDRRRLAMLDEDALPPALRNLAAALSRCGEKGEQEGYL